MVQNNVKITQNKNLLLLSLICFFLELYFISPVIVFFFQQKGINIFQIILLEVIQVGFTLILEIPTGILADKIGKKKVIHMGIAMYLIAYYIMLISSSFLHFTVSFAFFGIGFAFLSGTLESLLYDDLVHKGIERHMIRAMGHLGFFTIFASVIAPPIGSYIARDMLPQSFNILIILSIVSTFIGGLISLFVKDVPDMRVTEKSSLHIIIQGLNVLFANRSLLRIVLLSIFTNPFYVLIMYLFQPYLREAGVETVFFGTIISVAFLFASISQRYAYFIEKTFSVKTASGVITFLPGALYIAMAFISHRVISVLLFIILLIIISFREPIFSDYKNMHIPDEVRTTVLSFISFLTILYLIVARLIIGYIADFSIPWAFTIMGSIILFSSVPLRIRNQHLVKRKKSHI